MAVQKQLYTIEDFKQFVSEPEHSDRLFELINGEIIEKMPGTTRNSSIAAWIIFFVRLFCREREIPCFITGEQGTYNIQGHAFAPDFAYKQTPTSAEYPDPVAPRWVVEVISPNDKPLDIRAKRTIYIAAGILYWELYPEDQSVDVYAPGQPVRTYGIDDTIDVGDVLPDFSLVVKEIFAV